MRSPAASRGFRRGYAFPPSLNHLRIFAIRVLVIGPLYAWRRTRSAVADLLTLAELRLTDDALQRLSGAAS